MNAAYAAGFKSRLPDCEVTNDCFHIANAGNEHTVNALSLVAKDLESQGKTEAAKTVLADSTASLITRGLDLSPEERTELDAILELHTELGTIRRAIEEFHEAYKLGRQGDKAGMEQHLNEALVCCNSFQEPEYTQERKVRVAQELKDHVAEVKGESNEPQEKVVINYATCFAQDLSKAKATFRHPMVSWGNTIASHWIDIINFGISQLTTGPMEGFNNLLKSSKHSKFGIKDFARFILRLKARSTVPYQGAIKGHIIRPRIDSEYGQRLIRECLNGA